ncbi:MAG: hypothetical protein DI527_00725 [Chelatococcus sp.]|nr:MAG: hypothetical protein DI527_00725 [Chelatococcus sp.]
MSIFDRAERLMSRSLGRVYHELVLITPMRPGRMVVSADPDRAPFTIRATLNVEAQPRRPLGEGNTAGDVGVIMAPDISLAIEVVDLEGKPAIKNGDRVTAIRRPGQPVYVVAQEQPLGISERRWELLPDAPEDDGS